MTDAFPDDVSRLVDLLGFPHPEGIRPVFADIPGPAFFPGGTGVLRGDRACRTLPRGGVLVLGHNFDKEAGYEATKRRGREDLTNATWRGLRALLGECGVALDECFFNNALMGVMRTASAMGRHPGHLDSAFRAGCRAVFAEAMSLQAPRSVLALGIPAVNFLGETVPALDAWRAVQTFADLDASGPVRRGAATPGHAGRFSAAGLVHPSYRHVNARRRRYGGLTGHAAEVAMVKACSGPRMPP